MDAGTYPEKPVVDFVSANFIPLRIKFDAEPYAKDFNVKWTPTLVTLSPEGKEHHRTVGFLAAEELIPSLLLGKAKYHFDNDRFDPALKSLDQVAQQYAKSPSAPEAIFLTGVCQYKSTKNPKPLKAAYEKLAAQFPDNEWTKRAYPYRLL